MSEMRMEDGPLKLSTKGRYGVMACYDLARYGDGGPVPLKVVAAREGISEAYLEQLLGALRRAGLVHTVRGPRGGYTLSRDAAAITVGDIIRVLEGPIAPVDCVAEKRDGFHHCARTGECVTRFVWERLRDSITRVLDGISLKDLVGEGVRREGGGGDSA